MRVSTSEVGTGGMASKLEAARRATMAGAHVVIADARNPGILVDIAAGKDVGTVFVPPRARLSAKEALDRLHPAPARRPDPRRRRRLGG